MILQGKMVTPITKFIKTYTLKAYQTNTFQVHLFDRCVKKRTFGLVVKSDVY